ncbi:MAG TPA: A/G-specific adenine glycosylase, partial [Gemmata sp.]|nr:A/G-specific adenine glycosylase [Gemmata sp.]
MHLHDRPPQFPSGRAVAGLRIKLLNWFDRHHRALPWRANRDPYSIWVSEVMLQQTTVAAVVPYFKRFLAAFPTIAALAEANEQQVLKLWEGLGYYRRARHLHAAAKELVAKHAGIIPSDPAVWAGLPGVGRYILGAVLSQSFDSRLPIVEANSLRVLSRLLGYRGDPRVGEGKALIWSSAEALLPKKRVGDFNQALMELGALVCLRTLPLCGQCPLSAYCKAHRNGLQEKIPPPKIKPVIEEVNEVGVVVRKGSKVLLCRRPAHASRWQNMWEVPHGPIHENEEIFAAAARVTRELTGLEVETEKQFATIHHSVTRYRIT